MRGVRWLCSLSIPCLSLLYTYSFSTLMSLKIVFAVGVLFICVAMLSMINLFCAFRFSVEGMVRG